MRRARVAIPGLLLALAACSSASTDSRPSVPSVPNGSLAASITQFRPQEGTAQLSAGITDNGSAPITVTRVTVDWEGLAFPATVLRGRDARAEPGETVAFTLTYGAPSCELRPPADPILAATVNGRSTRLPLEVQDPGLLERLRLKACAADALSRAATVRLVLSRTTIVRAGAEYLPGQVVVRRRPGSRAPVRIVDLGGSVLFSMASRNGAAALPALLDRRTEVLSLPVLFGSAGRCDAHSRGQSQQSFLFSAYLRLGDAAPQRQTFTTSAAARARLSALLDRECRQG